MERRTTSHAVDVSNKIVGKDEVERLIDDYENKSSNAPMKGKLNYLRSADRIAKLRLISFPVEGESRVNATVREYKGYSLMTAENYTHFVFCIEYSLAHPLLMEEEQRLRNFFMGICPKGSTTLFYSAADASLGEKVLVTIICSR